MSEKYEKTTTPNHVLDKVSGVIINTDVGQYTAIKKARQEKKRQYQLEDTVRRLEMEIMEMKDDIARLMGKIDP